MKKTVVLILAIVALLTAGGCGESGRGKAGPGPAPETPEGGTSIVLSDSGVTVDGQPAAEDSSAGVYTARDIIYYESGRGFTYGKGDRDDEHSPEEAAAHTVVHIAAPGVYRLSGSISAGQIAVDLGKDAKKDPEAVVSLVLDGVDITCTVAPAIIFYNVYECGDKDSPSPDVDTAGAGANVYIGDGTVNNVRGSYVARIYKSIELSSDNSRVVSSKELHKYDGALYSRMSMNVSGDGVLNIEGENEGLCSELHLTVYSGTIGITARNDGINTSADDVSTTVVNGGELTLTITGDGDGIDSNGWIVINGGTVLAYSSAYANAGGLDSNLGIAINGGRIISTGNKFYGIDEDGGQRHLVFELDSPGGAVYSLRDDRGEEVMEVPTFNAFTVLVVSSPDILAGQYGIYDGGTLLALSK